MAGKMYTFEWDVLTDKVVRSSEHVDVFGVKESLHLTHQQFMDKVHPEDRPRLTAAIARLTIENPTCNVSYRVMVSDGAVVWITSNGHAFFDEHGRMLRLVGMVADVTEQKLAEEALRGSEERLRLAQQVARIGSFERNIRTGVNTWTPEMESMYGLKPGEFGQTRTAFENLIFPDDRARVIELVDRALKTGQPTNGEWRVIWPDGSIRWIAGRWQVLTDESGEPSRVVGVNIDVTDRKQAEEALSGMTRKLVEAQEQERARIARELHDDISQRLALLAVEIGQLRDNPSDVEERAEKLRKETDEISRSIQALSHDLHSSHLEYLGASAGMKSWCREFGERQRMQIDCRNDVRSPLPPEIGLCLFRVLQEALYNAAKHSGAKRIEAQIYEESAEIHLIVRDTGKGFDPESARKGKGLGLTSMQERVRLVNGSISIESGPMSGTTIHVRVPIRSEPVSHRGGWARS
jgi:PAS domain S-box-containing protein